MESWTVSATTFMVVCPMTFLAGFVDSVAGGGGLISLPAYIFAGLPVHMAYGTNKLSSCCGTAVAVASYSRSGYILWRIAAAAGAGAAIGSWCGAELTMVLSPDVLNICILVILPVVAVFLLFRRDFGTAERETGLTGWRQLAMAAAIGLVLGAYDGFFGPGTGTFVVIALTALLGESLTSATGNTKVINLCSNGAALAAFLLGGKVLWVVGLPAAVCNIAGNYLGSHMAIKRGAAFIRPVILVSVGLLFVTILTNIR